MIAGDNSMSDPNEERVKLSREVKELTAHIASLKRALNALENGPEKDLLREEIRMRQHQALLYIDKIENL